MIEEPNIKVSAIIPTFNKAHYLDRTLASYESQTCCNFELVITDDGSTDATRDVLASYDDALPLSVRHTANTGRSLARNNALDRARGRLLIFSDDDMIVPPGFIEGHLRYHQSTDYQYYLIGWKAGIRVHDSSDNHLLFGPADICERFAQIVEEWAMPIHHWRWKTNRFADVIGPELPGCSLTWFLGSTGNLSVAREHVSEIGGFDNSYQGWGMEDTDLCYRLSRKIKGSVITGLSDPTLSTQNYHQNHPRSPSAGHELRENLRLFVDKYDTLETTLFSQWLTGRTSLGECFRRLGVER